MRACRDHGHDTRRLAQAATSTAIVAWVFSVVTASVAGHMLAGLPGFLIAVSLHMLAGAAFLVAVVMAIIPRGE